MKYFHKQVWLGFITAIVIIAWLAIASFSNNKKSEDTARLVAHTNRVLYHTEQILNLVVDMESSQRGYALTGMKEYLAPKEQAAHLREHLESLKVLTSDNESQLERIDVLAGLVNHEIDFIVKAVDTRAREGLDKAIVLNSDTDGRELMQSIRTTIREIQAEEHQLLKERTALTTKRIDDFNAAFAGMFLATGIIIIAVFYMIYVSVRRRAEAEQSLRIASDTIRDIYDNAPCGYHSINADGLFVEINNTWLQWLKYSREEVVNKKHISDILTEKSIADFQINFPRFQKDGKISDLLVEVIRKDGTTFIVLLNSTAEYDSNGKFVKSRSTAVDYTQQKKALEKIEQLNQELESFSYSVSHDLRAPLRSIDGYTQILLEDYAQSLDPEGKRVLGVVVNNARKMAKLIDDLLDFSRVGRKELTTSGVNMEAMVRSVVFELKALEETRNIQVTISPLDACEADANLIRQVWVNLISNAIKYTRRKDKAVIDISSQRHPNEVVYRVHDNGTGFDMQYAHKLFGVFQRLHRQQDFEGTGVGLAIVHRIVTRHGGRVWAEGDVDKGASFYFSLPIAKS